MYTEHHSIHELIATIDHLVPADSALRLARSTGVQWAGQYAARWKRWMLFPAGVTAEEALEACRLAGWALGGHGTGPGGTYSNPAKVRVTKSRTLVTQLTGLDI